MNFKTFLLCLLIILACFQITYSQETTDLQEQSEKSDEQQEIEENSSIEISEQQEEEQQELQQELSNIEENENNNSQELADVDIISEVEEDEIDDEDEEQQNQGFECVSDGDCESLHNCIENVCVHKALFPLTGQEMFGIVVILILVGFAQAGGIGGGPILMPILLAIMNYDTKQAIALSFVLIFGGSCGNFLNNSGNKTEHQTPLIWYDLVLLSLPFLMSGAILGVIVNHFLPPIVIMLILIYVLYGSATKTYKNYKNIVQKEKEVKNDVEIPLVDLSHEAEVDTAGITPFKKSDPNSVELDEIYEQEKIQYPKDKFLKMFGVLSVIICLSLLKGGKGLDSPLGIEACGLGMWAMNFVIIGVCFYMSYVFGKSLIANENKKEACGYDFAKYGQKFDDEKIYKTGKSAFTAGVVGGLLGLGGGVILTPKWLDMGIPSDRTAATATFTVCFTSFISFFSSLLAGKYLMEEVIFFYVISFIASYFVSRILKYMVDKYKKKSILIAVLLGVILLAITLLPILQIISLIQKPADSFAMGKLC